ncbi:MAG: hypothetical protein J0M07_31875, partial [Anaerolineae bacterium]|nr:hypothetical protein [Anaerolineae bacterium]
MTRVLTRLAPLAQIPPLTTHRRDLFILLTAFAVTRLFVVVIGVLSMTYLDSTQGEEYTHLLDGGLALAMWYRWDAGFYATTPI